MAAEAIKKNRVKVNGEIAKSSRNVMPEDNIQVRKDQIDYSYRILQIPKSRMGAKLVTLYLVDQTPKEELDKLELRRLDQKYYRQKGEGRPTKKDRRDLDEFISPEGN